MVVDVAVSSLLLFVFVASAHADPLADNQARFGKIQGTVYLLTQGAKDWIDAHEDLPIEPGDEIHAEDDSNAEIILGERALILLEPDADLIADTIETDGGRAHLTDGGVLARVDGEGAERLQHWSFGTPGADANMHNAAGALLLDDKDQTHVAVLEKNLELQPAEGPQGLPPLVKLAAPQEALLRRRKPVQVQPRPSKIVQPLVAQFNDVATRQRRIEDTWSPLTTTYRLELRRKYVKPVAPSAPHPHPVRRRRVSVPSETQ